MAISTVSRRRGSRDGEPVGPVRDVLVVGSGALATLFAARLGHLGDTNVTLAGTWSAALTQIADEGIRLASDGETRRVRVAATRRASVHPGSADLVLVLVKQSQTRDAVREVAHACRRDGLVLSLQNGLGAADVIAAAVGPERTAVGVTTAGATLTGPGAVREAGAGTTFFGMAPSTSVDASRGPALLSTSVDASRGPAPPSTSVDTSRDPAVPSTSVDTSRDPALLSTSVDTSRDPALLSTSVDSVRGMDRSLSTPVDSLPSMAAPSLSTPVDNIGAGAALSTPVDTVVGGPTAIATRRLQAVADLLSRAGFPTTVEPDITPRIWAKLAVNCGINPVTAILGQTNRALLDDAVARAVAIRAAEEVEAVADALGIARLSAPVRERLLAVAEATQTNRSSMLQDLDRGAATEIGALNGAVVDCAGRIGLPVPVNAWLTAHVLHLERGEPAGKLTECLAVAEGVRR